MAAAAGASPLPVGNLPVTETANDVTMNIDVMDPRGAVRLLRQADAQIFAGWHEHPGVYDDVIIHSIQQAVAATAAVFRGDARRSCVVMSGCGTSGRMAAWAAKTFNAKLRALGEEPRCRYLVSGGDPAILLSDELPEDDAHKGAAELAHITEGCDNVVYIGISCGLSASYVLGQTEYSSKQPGFTTVLMGFNPATLARPAAIDGWDRTCRDVAMELAAAADAQHILLTPVVGPEPITGSTRMKGGTTTKILLETVLGLALRQAFGEPVFPCSPPASAETASAHSSASAVLQAYELTYRATYLHANAIGDVAALAAHSLRAHRHLYYVGSARAGPLGLIDASEMPDTYGSPFDEVRGFCDGGWASIGNVDGDLSSKSIYCRIALEDFARDIVPTLSADDTVVAVLMQGDDAGPTMKVVNAAVATGAAIAAVTVGQSTGAAFNVGESEHAATWDATVAQLRSVCKHVVRLEVPFLELCRGVPAFAEISLKWALNCISTIAQVQRGAVYQNRMINVGVLNNKLFFRAIDLICQFASVSQEVAKDCLLQSIHEVDVVSDDIAAFTVTKHIQVATPKSNVLPIAMLLATGRFTRASALDALRAEPVLRTLVKGIHLG